MSLGTRIRARRERLGLTQQDLAQRMQMTQAAVSRLEHDGVENPGATILRRLAIALQCSVDWLLEMYDDAPDDISALLPAGASP